MSDMSNRAFGKQVAELIRIRRAEKALEIRKSAIADQVKAEMKKRGITEHSTPSGDVTLYDETRMSISARKLFNRLGADALRHMTVRIGDVREVHGDEFVNEAAVVEGVITKLLTKPAKKKAKLKVVMSGYQPAI